MATEDELRNNNDDSERVRELQEQVAELKAEVNIMFINILFFICTFQTRV